MTDRGPTITIGIPTLDRYRYVASLLDDLAEQTRLPDEVVIVDQTAPQRRQRIPTEKWRRSFPIRVINQDEKGTSKARNLLLRECRSDLLLQPDDDVRIEPDFVHNHARHFADYRVDVVSGPVYEWDGESHEWYVRWKNHLLLGGPDGPAFVAGHSYSGGNSCVRVSSALAIGGWDENIETHGEDEDFSDRLHSAGAVIVYDPRARLFHLRAPRGGERADAWGTPGPEGNWRVLAGYLYYFLANRPAYEAWAQMVGYSLRPLWHIKNRRTTVGLRLLPRVLVAIPAASWRWARGRLLIDDSVAGRPVRRIPKKRVALLGGALAGKSPRTVLPHDPPELPT